MKSSKIILLASLMLAPLGAWAQKMKVSNDVVDCGQVAYQSPVTAEFEVTNKGNHAM